MSEEKPNVNILLIGESGVGKSTFINSFANYLTHKTPSTALLVGADYRIPAQFIITDDKLNDTVVNIGDYKGEVTLEVTDHIFEVEHVKLRLIDTPGVGSYSGIEEDAEKVKAIIGQIEKYGHLNAIALIVKSNATQLNGHLKFYINSLLLHLDESAYQNVIFIFTHGRATFYKPGDAIKTIRGFLAENQLKLPFAKSNMFCLDNETFRYLVGRSLNYTEQDVEAFETSWRQSVACCLRIIEYVFGDSKLKPLFIKPRRRLEELFAFLADLSCSLDDNLTILHFNSDYEATPLIFFEKAQQSGDAVFICKSLECTSLQEIGRRKVDVIKGVCHLDIKTAENCTVCKCPSSYHEQKKYVKRISGSAVINSFEERYRSKYPNRRLLINSLEDELDFLLNVLATITVYMIQTFKLSDDLYILYLRDKHTDYNNLSLKYSKIKQLKQTITHTFNLEDISKYTEQLKDLDWTGASIKNIFGNDFCVPTEVPIKNRTFKLRAIQDLLQVEELDGPSNDFLSEIRKGIKLEPATVSNKPTTHQENNKLKAMRNESAIQESQLPNDLLSEIRKGIKLKPVGTNKSSKNQESRFSGDLLREIRKGIKLKPVGGNKSIQRSPFSGDLLREIRKGIKLKPVTPRNVQATTVCHNKDANWWHKQEVVEIPEVNSELLVEIRRGIKLKPVQQRKSSSNNFDFLQKAINERKMAVNPDVEDSVCDSSDDAWD